MAPADIARFRDAVASLGAIQAQIGALDAHDDDGWRLVLVDRRRYLQVQVATLGEMLALAPVDDQVLHEAFNRMRSRIALHQASWPAVAIDKTDPGYQSSVMEIRAASRDFLALAERWLESMN